MIPCCPISPNTNSLLKCENVIGFPSFMCGTIHIGTTQWWMSSHKSYWPLGKFSIHDVIRVSCRHQYLRVLVYRNNDAIIPYLPVIRTNAPKSNNLNSRKAWAFGYLAWYYKTIFLVNRIIVLVFGLGLSLVRFIVFLKYYRHDKGKFGQVHIS